MSMVEVDPNLFIKCRLCIEESGTYQIVPLVREQISYCFEINVEPFDGLPQLICKKCQSILCDYSKTKRSFIEKQDVLRKITQENCLQQEVKENFESAVKRESSNQVAKCESKRRKISQSTISSSESRFNYESNNEIDTKKQDWTKEYQKTFACRMCNSAWFTWKSAKNHKTKHKTLKNKHKDVFSKYCVVELPKIDCKPNLTRSMDKVVYSKSKIIAKGNSEYSIAYTYKGKNSSDNESFNRNESFNLDESSDSSSKNNNRVRRRRRIRRISSRSSTETLVLENKSNGKSINNECINIDDTDSDNESKKKQKTKVNKDSVNSKFAVAKLIATTQNKYLKKHQKPEKPSQDQLNRKITSIGRQIINKRGFNCTRVMKYLEHMNLNIIWLSRSPVNVTSSSNYFKIMPRLKYPNEKNVNSFEGYKLKYEKQIEVSKTEETLVQEANVEDIPGVSKESNLVEAVQDVVENTKTLGHQPDNQYVKATLTANNKLEFNVPPDLNAGMLYSVVAADTRKLLNANPVANPRQLPKKFTSDTKKDKVKSAPNMFEAKELSNMTSSVNENNIQMPIITFTTSLAVPQAETSVSKETSTNISADNNPSSVVNSNSENPKPTAPRIKVKSVTELMSKETLSRMNESTPEQIPQNGSAYGAFEGHQVENTMPIINNVQSLSPHGFNCDDYVILDTVELPNTKTSSPFKYFRMLLQVHNLTLLDTDTTLTADFHTLIKFKVLYKQETKDQPVVLCLSLFCANNIFCLKVKDRNEDNINMAKISANWQWEILKIYRGEVVTKVLYNAKKVSPEVHEKANSFLCLLKSINFVPK